MKIDINFVGLINAGINMVNQKMTRARDNRDGTTSIVEIEFDDEGEILKETIIDMYDNETGYSLYFNEENKRWEYPKEYFKHYDEDLQEEVE